MNNTQSFYIPAFRIITAVPFVHPYDSVSLDDEKGWNDNTLTIRIDRKGRVRCLGFCHGSDVYSVPWLNDNSKRYLRS